MSLTAYHHPSVGKLSASLPTALGFGSGPVRPIRAIREFFTGAMEGSIPIPADSNLIEFSLPQTIKQVIHRLQQCVGVAIHTANCVAVHCRQRRLLIELKELAHTNNYVERRAQLVTHRFREFIAVAFTG